MSRKIIMLKLLLARDGFKRAKILKKGSVFASMGDNCYWHPFKFPSEGKLVSLGNNVVVSSGVSLITHDMSYALLGHDKRYRDYETPFYTGKITIGDNVMIGANALIMPNVTIGSNVIIAAGSIVTKSIADNSVVGGVPAKYIESYEDFAKKRVKPGKEKNSN